MRHGLSRLTCIAILLTVLFYTEKDSWSQTGSFLEAQDDNCTAILDSDLRLYIPVVTFGRQSYWAELRYDAGHNFVLTTIRKVADRSPFSSCNPSTFSPPSGILHIPDLNYAGGSYWVNLQYTQGLHFALIDYSLKLTSPWPMFHHDPRHTGQSGNNGPRAAKLRWKYTDSDIIEGTYPNSPSISQNGKTIYVTAGNKLLAINTGTGQVTWSASTGGIGGTAVASDGTVYAVGGEKLYAFTSSGVSKWVFADPTDNIFGEPNIGSDGTIYMGSWDTYVYTVRSDGTLKWQYKTDGSIAPMASPTLSYDGSTVYVGSGDRNKTPDGTLYALNSSDGTLKWKVKVDQMRASGAVVGSDETIYVCGSGRVIALNPSGTQLWQSAQDTASNLTPALSNTAIIYVGTAEGKIFAIDARTGDTIWSYQTGENPDPTGPQYGVLTAPVIGANGTVYVGAVDGKMYALKSDGTLLWAYQTGASIVESSPAMGKDGTLYFGSTDKYLYAIKRSKRHKR